MKFRNGGDTVVQTVGSLAQQHGMDTTLLDSATMLARLEDARVLAPLRPRVARMLKRIDDMIFQAQGDSWGQALEFYALMQRRATSDGDLAVGLASVESFFSSRSRSAQAGKPTKRQKMREAKARAALKVLGISPPEVVATPPQVAATPAATPVSTPPPATSNGSGGVLGLNGVVHT